MYLKESNWGVFKIAVHLDLLAFSLLLYHTLILLKLANDRFCHFLQNLISLFKGGSDVFRPFSAPVMLLGIVANLKLKTLNSKLKLLILHSKLLVFLL